MDNVYTQHTPLLTATLTNLATDKLDVASYPFMASTAVRGAWTCGSSSLPPWSCVDTMAHRHGVWTAGVCAQDEAMAYQATFRRAPPREVIVFIIGGSTFEEAKAVAEWNDRNPQMRVVLGGTAVLNSSAFLAALGGGAGPAGGEGNGHFAVDVR